MEWKLFKKILCKPLGKTFSNNVLLTQKNQTFNNLYEKN